MRVWVARSCRYSLLKVVGVFLCLSVLIFISIQNRTITLTIHVPRRQFLHDHQDQLFTDEKPKVSDDLAIEDLQRSYPNFPIAFWYKHKSKPMEVNKTCSKFPNVFDLNFNNHYWQTLLTSNGTVQLYGAYLDVRPKSRIGPAVRVLVMIDRVDPKVETHCQFWFDAEKQPVIAKSIEYKLVWNKKWGNNKQGIYQPYLIACPLPKAYAKKVPDAVSLVERPCDHSANSLKVIYREAAEKKDFAVCVKGLDYLHVDLSVKLVEWIELLLLLGADKIFFYELQVHPNISKVLKHYEGQNQVEVTPISLAGAQPNGPSFQHFYLKNKVLHKRQNELIPYNDCFYRHMYEYKYVVLLDIDEVIMPVGASSWKELMETIVLPKALKLKNEERASYNVRNVYFLDDLLHDHGWFDGIPKYMHMLQHVYRTKNFTKPGHYIKCFHNTERVVTLHNHYPLACFGNACTTYAIETSDAHLQHYRADCVNELKKSCKQWKADSVLDTSIWKFKRPLIEKVTDTLRTLKFLTNSKAEDIT